MAIIDRLLEHDLLPDSVLRLGIRRLLRKRIAEESGAAAKVNGDAREELLALMAGSPVALRTDAANEQHYEVPTEFFRYCLGPRMKYSSALWDGCDTLAEAEEAMLRLTEVRAELVDGQRVLELGCGWGSLTLWLAENYPESRITGVSNSATQKEFIDGRARALGLTNVDIVTADMNSFQPGETFDRIVSVEMFEHMRNWEVLMERISKWLTADGKFFMHIFTHRSLTYFFEDRDASDWMSRYFFTGGMMPSEDLPHQFQKHLQVDASWRVNGEHYARTAEAWLANMERNEAAIIPLLARTYGAGESTRWWVYWRVFYMACAELWGYNKGQEWFVSHYLLSRPSEPAT